MNRVITASGLALALAFQAVAPAVAQETYDYNSPSERRQRYLDNTIREHDRVKNQQSPQDSSGDALGAVILAGIFAYYLWNSTSTSSSDAHQPAQTSERAKRYYNSGSDAYGAPTYRVVSVPVGDVLNMRAGPGSDYRLVGAIPARGAGVEVETCDRSYEGARWCLASYGGQRGWVAARLLTAE